MKKLYFLSLTFLVISLCQAQYCTDGSYCPIPTDPSGTNSCGDDYNLGDDEWANATFVDLPNGAGSCEVNDLYADLDLDELDVVIALTRGNQGTATFLFYFNTDCDNTSGDTSIGQNGVIRNGSEFRVQVEVKNNGDVIVEDIGEWDGTDYAVVPSSGVAAAGAVDGCSGSNLNFVEFRFPVEEIFNPCLGGGCSSVEITAIETKSGGAINSSACDEVSITINIPINNPPEPEFQLPADTLCQSIVTGNFPVIFIDAGLTNDLDLADGDSLDYTWSSNLEDDLVAFSNQSGTKETNMSAISTFYAPTQAGTHEITLTVTDRFLCDSTVTGSLNDKYSIVILPNDDPRCLFFPITLSSFNAEYRPDQTVELNWTTETETNSEFFYVQRKTEGVTEFENIAQLNAAGNSTTSLSYSFTDEVSNLNTALVYYRLLEVDFDGAETYSDIVAVRIGVIHQLEMKIYPNPVKDLIKIDISNTSNDIEIFIQDLEGRVIDQIQINAARLNESIEINTNRLTAGAYFISAKSANEIVRQQIIVLR